MSFADIFYWIAHLNLLIVIPSIFGGLLVLGTLMAYISDESYREGINEFLLVLLVTTIIVLLYAYMFTDELDIFPNINIVLTKKPVKIIQEPNIEIYGIGMKYDNKEGIVKLLSNVKVHYGSPRKNEKIN